MQDLGIFAYRIVGQESIASGSALDLVHNIQSGKDGADTAIVIANLGQLLWNRRGQRAMTMATWNSLPRKTGVSGPTRIDAIKNHIPGNEGVREHVASVFAAVEKLAKGDVAIDIIGIGEGAEEVVEYLDQYWERWEGKVRAMCVGVGFVWSVGDQVRNGRFMEFWSKVCFNPTPVLYVFTDMLSIQQHARAYLIHNEPVETPLHGRAQLGCNCFSSGEATFTECIMPCAYKSMLAFFQLVNDVPGYFEAEVEPQGDDSSGYVSCEEGVRSGVCAESPRAA